MFLLLVGGLQYPVSVIPYIAIKLSFNLNLNYISCSLLTHLLLSFHFRELLLELVVCIYSQEWPIVVDMQQEVGTTHISVRTWTPTG